MKLKTKLRKAEDTRDSKAIMPHGRVGAERLSIDESLSNRSRQQTCSVFPIPFKQRSLDL